jgi:hypothetical protein
MSRYRTTWTQIQEQMNEFTLVHVARWRGKDGKRYASPFKTKDSAEKRAKELRTQGNSEVSVTQDTLKGNIKWAKDGGPDIKGMQKEENDHEVSMARGELEAIADKATQLASMLQGKSDEGNPLEAWVQSKITKAKDYINSVSDYLIYNPDMKQNEEVELEEAMSDAQLKKVRDSYKDLKTISPEKVKTLRNFLDRYSTDSLMQLAQANINFVSTMARSVMNKRKMGDPKHAGSMKEEKSDSERIADLRTKQMMLQTKVRDMNPTKDKTDIEIAKNKLDNMQLRMDKIKSKNEEVHPAKSLIEAIEGLKNKSEKSGVPYGILKQVYDRGMAAWKGGHRPGTTPQQWAFARVNSFLTGGKTRTTADADLWKKARAAKSKK